MNSTQPNPTQVSQCRPIAFPHGGSSKRKPSILPPLIPSFFPINQSSNRAQICCHYDFTPLSPITTLHPLSSRSIPSSPGTLVVELTQNDRIGSQPKIFRLLPSSLPSPAFLPSKLASQLTSVPFLFSYPAIISGNSSITSSTHLSLVLPPRYPPHTTLLNYLLNIPFPTLPHGWGDTEDNNNADDEETTMSPTIPASCSDHGDCSGRRTTPRCAARPVLLFSSAIVLLLLRYCWCCSSPVPLVVGAAAAAVVSIVVVSVLLQ